MMVSRFFSPLSFAALLACASPTGCDSDLGDAEGGTEHEHEHEHDDEAEIITTISLEFVDEAGNTVTATFSDPDGDGGMSGTADPVVLAADTEYSLTLSFSNGLEDPPEDITPEIEEEAGEHQVFLYGDAVAGPATTHEDAALLHEYADMDDAGLPVGLINTINTISTSGAEGQLRVMLRHLPAENGVVVKEAGLAELLAAGDLLPGEPDVDVSFMVTVE